MRRPAFRRWTARARGLGRGYAAVTLFALLLLACGRGDRSEPDHRPAPSEQPRPGGILRIPIGSDPSTMNPLLGRPGRQTDLWPYFYPSLIQLQSRGARIPRILPDLARRLEWSEEARTLTFILRTDRYWEDTTQVRAGDVVQTFNAYRFMGRLPAFASRDSLFDPGLQAVEALDDSTVRLRFRPGFSYWRALPVAGWPILPAHKLGKFDRMMLEASPLGREPLSAGPFRLLDWRPGLNLWMGPNPMTPPAHRPFVREVAFEVSPGADSRILRLLLGEADVVTDLPVFRLAALAREDASNVRIHSGGPASVEMIFWNLRDPASLPILRQAVSLALDRDRLLSQVAEWDSVRYGGVPGGLLEPAGPDEPDSVAASVPFPRFDRTAADSLLDAAGWLERDSEGFRLRVGLPLRLTMIYDRSSELRERLVTYVEEDLARVGILLDPVPLDGTTFWQRYRAGFFETALLGFTVPATPDLSGVWASWGYWNCGGYASVITDSLITAQQGAAKEEEVLRLSRVIEAQIRADQPVTFILYLDGVAFLSPRVRGFDGDPWHPYGNLSRVWLADTTAAGGEGENAAREPD